jgi:hypothetical protein
MSILRYSALSLSLTFLTPAQAAYRAHYRIEGDGAKTLTDALRVPGQGESKLLRSLPYYIGHGPDDLSSRYEEWEYSESAAPAAVRGLATQISLKPLAENSEMRVIRQQGPATNRINLTILGDGYTLNEREKFFEDVERTVRGLFETPTFRSYLPLFNVYAVYVPSTVSGIGDGSPKNTAFRLYRNPAGSKRAIMPGDESAMSRALRLAPATDYPIVLANDEYYGGLGGRWAISTSSRSSGLIVLRHELGHNFGEVGEEYDNGYVYSGANASRSSRVPWKQWVQGETQVHEAELLSGDYVWKNLSQGAYQANFTMPSDKSLLQIELSTVGWSSPSEVAVTLNGTELSYDGVFHKDRSFFNFDPTTVAPGSRYQLKVEERAKDGDNVLGFALAYAMRSDYDFTSGKIGAFASYDAYGNKSYRPTHNSCLMKDMRRENFCAVDQENMWLKFLERIALLDGVSVSQLASGQRRIEALGPVSQDLVVTWFKKSSGTWQEISELKNQRVWETAGAAGDYRVSVRLQSAEVRAESRSLEDSKEFRLE